MSAEDKEPYFDGPLVTPNTGANMFYPGQNQPLPQVPQMAIPNPSGPPMVAPTFYNPNEFVAAAAPVGVWQPEPMQNNIQLQQQNNIGSMAEDTSTGYQGVQSYFGSLESTSSAASSQHTSPQHFSPQKSSDNSHIPPMDPQSYSSPSNVMYHPQLDPANQWRISTQNPSNIPASSTLSMSSLQDGHPTSPGSSILDPAAIPFSSSDGNYNYSQSAFLNPVVGSGNSGLQNYMNPESSDAPLPQMSPNQTENITSSQQSYEAETMLMNNYDNEGQDWNSLNAVDLHNFNSIPSSSQDTSDQSYMNMAHTNNYGGTFVQPTAQTVGATRYSGPDLPAEQPPIPVPSSSTQDYDILHSQGTWNDTRHNFATNYGQAQSSPQYYDQPTAYGEGQQQQQQPHGEDGLASKMENLQVEDNSEDPGFLAEQNTEASNDPTRVEGATLSGLQHVSFEPDTTEETASLSTVPGNSNLYSQSEASDTSPQKHNIESRDNELTNSCTNETTIRDPGGQDNVLSQPLGNLSSASYAYGPIVSAASKLQPENTAEDFRENIFMQPPTGAQMMHAIVPPNQESELPTSSSGTNDILPTEYSEPIKVMTQENRDIVQTTDGDTQSHNPINIKLNTTAGIAAFATSVSTVDSRMRSQSTGSNNSTTSSQKSAGSQKTKPAAPTPLRQNVMSAHAAEPQPSGNPFSTNTMHSSHIEMKASSSSASLTHDVQLRPQALVSEVGQNTNAHAEADENLRTGASASRNNPQSLHSQVLSSYSTSPDASSIPGPPPPPAMPDQLHNIGQAAMVSSGTMPEMPNVPAAPVSNKPEDRTATGPSSSLNVANSDPYLSRSLHTTTEHQHHQAQSSTTEPSNRYHDLNQRTELQPTQVYSPERRHNERSQQQGIPSSQSTTMTETADLYQRDGSAGTGMHPDEPRRQTATEEDHARREDERRGEYEPRRQAQDSRRSEDPRYDRNGWDHHDSRYRTTGYDGDRPPSRQGLEQRPRSRQGYRDSGHPYEDREYNREYFDPYYQHYRRDDRYYDERYYRHPDYSRREYADTYDTRRYDSYYYPQRRYRNEDYYYDDYYGDYRYRSSQQYPAEEDTRSVHSEKSKNIDHEPLTDRSHHEYQRSRNRSSYAEHPSYMHEYDSYAQDNRYYGDSLMDETTISANYDDSWQRLPQVPARQTPVKFVTTHTIARFGPGGHLVKVLPNRPLDNQPCKVEIHSIEILLQNTEEAENLRSYPGPLSKEETHKNDILQFSSLHSAESINNIQLMDRQSTALIWDFLALLVRQNGSVLGTDIAELLMKGHSGDFKLLQSPLEASNRQRQQLNRTTTPSSVLDDAQSPAPDETESVASSSDFMSRSISLAERNSSRFRELLLHGRKKDSLEWAMKTGLWGHALLLASKTDSRTHAQVMLRFANSLPINDPLQTVYQLMSGRQPAAATCVAEEGWGDWRPHLAMVLSNPTTSASLDMRAVLTMGDTLTAKGLLHAAHFCYLMASTPLGYYGRPTSKMVLLGANHMLPFKEFATWDAIRRTEIYEYAISLGKSQNYSVTALPSFQLHKFVYACTLAEYGLVNQAFHYCERIAKAVCRNPANYSATLVGQLLNVSEQLKHHDPQVQTGTLHPNNLRWLETLRNVDARFLSGAIVPNSANTPSVIATSNTPSVISTAPTSPSPNDEIRFSAHTPDLDDEDGDEEDEADDDDEVDTGNQRSPVYTEPPYGKQREESSAAVQAPVPMMPVNTGTYQPQMYPTDQGQQNQYGTYYNPEDHQQNQGYQDTVTYNQQQPQFQQQQQTQQLMNNQAYKIQQEIAPPFNDLAHQANPLAPGVPSFPQQHHPYQQAQYNQQMNDPSIQQVNQMDYYDHVSAMPSQRFATTHVSSRSRTVSQSSQRSRASTLKGYDRTTPTSMLNTDQKQRSRTTSENSAGRRSRKTSGEQKNYNQTNKSSQQSSEHEEVKKSSSWSLFGWLSRKKTNQAHLPDDTKKEIYWDNDKNCWVNTNASEEENSPPPPPPMDSESLAGAIGQPMQSQQPMMAGPMSNPTPPGPASTDKLNEELPKPQQNSPHLNRYSKKAAGNQSPSLTANRFSLKNLGSGRSMYKNVLSTSSTPAATAPPPEILPGLTSFIPQKNTGFMVPNAALGDAPMGPSPMATSTPNHPAETSQTIPMFTPGNTPQGSASDFAQPFNHAGNSRSSSVSSGAREIRKLVALSEDAENARAPTLQGSAVSKDNAPTMFYNPSQFGTNPMSGPSMTPLTTGQGNRFSAMRGRGRGFSGRR